MIMVSFEITDLPYAKAENFTNDEISERYEVYDEIMGRDEGWKLKTERKGIKVYHRDVSLTPIKAFKGVAELETDLTSMCAFLMDIYNFPSWIVMCDSVELLKPADEDVDKINQVAYAVYTINRPPWPVKPRDNVVCVTAAQDPNKLTLKVKAMSLPEAIPLKKGFVRCPLLMIEWKLRPLVNGNIELTFELIINAGGWVPAWVINFYAVDIPYRTILNIRKQIPFNEKYKQKKIRWLEVPPSHKKTTYVGMNK
jgi:hypothetical protein